MSNKVKSILRPVGTVIIPATEWFDPTALQSNENLWLTEDFIKKVRDRASAGPVEELVVPYGDLKRSATIGEIDAESKREYTPLVACYVIHTLSRQQQNGEAGHMLTKRFSNIITTIEGLVAYARWYSSYGQWFIREWPKDDGKWGQGIRVL